MCAKASSTGIGSSHKKRWGNCWMRIGEYFDLRRLYLARGKQTPHARKHYKNRRLMNGLIPDRLIPSLSHSPVEHSPRIKPESPDASPHVPWGAGRGKGRHVACWTQHVDRKDLALRAVARTWECPPWTGACSLYLTQSPHTTLECSAYHTCTKVHMTLVKRGPGRNHKPRSKS